MAAVTLALRSPRPSGDRRRRHRCIPHHPRRGPRLSAQLPLSFWLSRGMDGPSPVSALLHSATMVAAGAPAAASDPVARVSGWAQPLVSWVGAATAVALGLVAVAQTDLKQLLAASTCSWPLGPG
ncbi:MAG TPA: proton-conducting transporter membrane subunit [Pseudonocardiaceae bacterium]|nr:proton-conducting transporter membrane subunit [Pseudonocardiaceae bacterium]